MKWILVLFTTFISLFASSTYAFTIVAPPESLVVSAIVTGPIVPPVPSTGNSGSGGFITPTSVTFSGTAAPFSKVFLIKDGQLLTTVIAGLDSKFTITINNALTNGNYTFSLYSEDASFNKSRLITFSLSIVSHTATTVSGIVLSILTEDIKNNFEKENDTKKCKIKTDLNNDCKVNLIDFSILTYWYKKVSFPKKIDFNNDGIINVIDFSIMAYHWTG